MSGWAYAANIAAAVGGVASLVAVLIGIRALKDSHATRLGEARDRDRQRLELIAEHLDRMRETAIAEQGQSPERNDWRQGLALLHRYLAATSLSLPRCREVASKGSAGEVLPAMVAADAEITGALGQLASEGGVDRQHRRGREAPLSPRPGEAPRPPATPFPQKEHTRGNVHSSTLRRPNRSASSQHQRGRSHYSRSAISRACCQGKSATSEASIPNGSGGCSPRSRT